MQKQMLDVGQRSTQRFSHGLLAPWHGVEDLLMSFMDSIKISYYNDAHKRIISESMRCREYSDRFSFTIYIAQECD